MKKCKSECPSARYMSGKPCSHPGCMRHKTHPCEGCGRIWGSPPPESLEDITTTCLIMAAGEYVSANLSRSQGSDMSDITKRLRKQWVNETKSFLRKQIEGMTTDNFKLYPQHTAVIRNQALNDLLQTLCGGEK